MKLSQGILYIEAIDMVKITSGIEKGRVSIEEVVDDIVGKYVFNKVKYKGTSEIGKAVVSTIRDRIGK